MLVWPCNLIGNSGVSWFGLVWFGLIYDGELWAVKLEKAQLARHGTKGFRGSIGLLSRALGLVGIVCRTYCFVYVSGLGNIRWSVTGNTDLVCDYS